MNLVILQACSNGTTLRKSLRNPSSLEGWLTKAKDAPSPHEIRLTLLDTNQYYQSQE